MGSQYCSKDYQEALEKHWVLSSMSRKGNCWDNAGAESFFGTLKTELVYLLNFDTRKSAKSIILRCSIIIKDYIHPWDTTALIKSPIQLAIEYIEKNSHTEISISDVANSINLSVFYFSRLFKKATGFSPYEYIFKSKISKSNHLLLYTEMNIEDIAIKTGFCSANTFIKAFKRTEATTPMKFRLCSKI